MKQQQTYMTSGISNMIATGGEIGDVVAKCLQAHNDGIWDYFDEEIGVSSTLCDEDIKWANIKFLIITEIGHEVTTVLLPDEY